MPKPPRKGYPKRELFRERGILELSQVIPGGDLGHGLQDKVDLFNGIQRMEPIQEAFGILPDIEIIRVPDYFASPGQGPHPSASFSCQFDLASSDPLKIILDTRGDLKSPRVAGTIYYINFLFRHYANAHLQSELGVQHGTEPHLRSFVVQALDAPHYAPRTVAFQAGEGWDGICMIPRFPLFSLTRV